MAESVSKITIFIDKDIEDIIKAKQMDANSRFLEVTLVGNNGVPLDLTGHIVRFNARKADFTKVFNNCEINDAVNGVFTVELTDQTLAIGNSTVTADISLHSEDEETILTTRTFSIHVQAMVRDDGAIESSNEFGAVITLFQDVFDLRVIIKDMWDKLGEPTDNLAGRPSWLQAAETLFGALNVIYNYVRENSAAGIVDLVNQIITRIGVANPTANTTTVMGYLRKINDGNFATGFVTEQGKFKPVFNDSLSAVATSAKYGSSSYSVATDNEFVYRTGIGSSVRIEKLDKKTLAPLVTNTLSGGAVEMVIDDSYIYCAANNVGSSLYKVNKNTLLRVANTSGSFNSVAIDDTFLYCSNITNKTVEKRNKSDLSVVAVSAVQTESLISVVIDNNHVYCAGGSARTIVKMHKSNLSVVATSAVQNDPISAVAIDDSYIYFQGRNTDLTINTIAKMNKSDLSVVAAGSTKIGTVSSIVVDDSHVYYCDSLLNSIVKMRKSDLSVVAVSAKQTAFAYSIAINDSYAYYADNTENIVTSFSLLQTLSGYERTSD